MISSKKLGRILATTFIVGVLSSCAALPNKPRMGMVLDEKTGLLFGSAIEKNLVTDASFYINKSIKVRTRNTSGDETFDLKGFTNDLTKAYQAKGYEPTIKNKFGLLMDINVVYSGQIQTNQTTQFSVIGALLGSTYGGNTRRGQIAGTVSGAALGQVLGAFAVDNTYMVIAEVTFGVVKKYKVSRKRITFSRSKKLVNIDDPLNEEKVYARGFKKSFTTQFTVYAGGRNVNQSDIADEVKRRAVRIAADFI